MKRIGIGVLIVAVIIVSALLYLRRGHVYEISQTDIQSRIESQFPVEKCVLVFCIELTAPFVRFSEQQSRIEFGSNALIEVAFSNEEYDGSAGFSGELRYVRSEISFYLDDSRLEYFNVNGVSEKHKDNLNQLASLLVTDYLRNNPVYSLQNTAIEFIAPWLELKQVNVRDGVLSVRLGLAI